MVIPADTPVPPTWTEESCSRHTPGPHIDSEENHRYRQDLAWRLGPIPRLIIVDEVL